MKSTVAQCAAAIRSELKSAFPGIKFSVTSKSFSMGNAVRISYTDGPTKTAVDELTAKYQYGSFNSMEDLYEHDNVNADLPQAKYIAISRQMSNETKAAIMAEMGIEPDQYNEYNSDWGLFHAERVNRKFQGIDFCARPEPEPEVQPEPLQLNKPETSTGANTDVYQQVPTEEKQSGVLLERHYELCRRAHRGTSFVPEERAHQYVRDYSEQLTNDLQRVKDLGGDPADYQTRYERHFTAWMSAKSNCISTMITGGSKFPVRRAEKANQSEHKRAKYFSQFREKYFARLERRQRREERAAIDPAEEMREKIEKAEKQQEAMKAANKIVKSRKLQDAEKAKQLAELLKVPEGEAATLLKHDFCGRIGFPDYALTNNLANIKRMRERLAELEAKAKATTKEIERPDGIRVVHNADIDRLQIFFPGKPAPEMIDALKRRAFKWSPSNGCWQRQFTANAISAMREILPTCDA